MGSQWLALPLLLFKEPSLTLHLVAVPQGGSMSAAAGNTKEAEVYPDPLEEWQDPEAAAALPRQPEESPFPLLSTPVT